jgi:curved DNA-binding protein CbpA
MEPTEIVALARVISEIDYYQLLELERGAVSGEVRRAYHDASRSFHPDANRHLPPELRDAVQVISKRVSEAYSVLRHPRRRQAYDQRLEAGEGVRIQLAEAEALAGRRSSEERGGRTPQGRQFYKLAERDLRGEDWAGAARNLQTALTFEPDNDLFKQQLASVREKLR